MEVFQGHDRWPTNLYSCISAKVFCGTAETEFAATHVERTGLRLAPIGAVPSRIAVGLEITCT